MEYFLFIAQSNSLALWLNVTYNSDPMDSNCFLHNKRKERKEGRKNERERGREEKKQRKTKKGKERKEGTSNLNKAIEIGARIENETQEEIFFFFWSFLPALSVVDSIKNCG